MLFGLFCLICTLKDKDEFVCIGLGFVGFIEIIGELMILAALAGVPNAH